MEGLQPSALPWIVRKVSTNSRHLKHLDFNSRTWRQKTTNFPTSVEVEANVANTAHCSMSSRVLRQAVVAARGAAPASRGQTSVLWRAGAVHARKFNTTQAVRGKEYTGVGLELDPNTGVRIDRKAFDAFPGVPRGTEYQSVLEQDPFGDRENSGGNDDIWGEWGLNRCTPQVSTQKGSMMLATAFGGLTLLGMFLKSLDHASNNPCAPREGVWGEGKPNLRV